MEICLLLLMWNYCKIFSTKRHVCNFRDISLMFLLQWNIRRVILYFSHLRKNRNQGDHVNNVELHSQTANFSCGVSRANEDEIQLAVCVTMCTAPALQKGCRKFSDGGKQWSSPEWIRLVSSVLTHPLYTNVQIDLSHCKRCIQLIRSSVAILPEHAVKHIVWKLNRKFIWKEIYLSHYLQIFVWFREQSNIEV